jgi:hypothetical protein
VTLRELVTAVVLVGAGLLAVAGVAKVRDPRPTRTGLLDNGLVLPKTLVVALGISEVASAIWIFATGSRRATVLVAAFYLVFALVTARAMARGGDRVECGCLGDSGATLGPTHLAFNTTMAAAATAAALMAPHRALLPVDSLASVVTIAAVAVATYLAYLLLTAFEGAMRSYQLTGSSRAPQTPGGRA